jgi:prepilin-type N-terminal cleavage/methylation domain-containing protein
MPTRAIKLTSRIHRAFTLAEVLAALALMAIIIPVAIHGVEIASRAGNLGLRKATAMRIAERVMNEQIVTSQSIPSNSNGTVTEDGIAYPWTLTTDTWPEEPMSVLKVRVTFSLQGNNYDMSVSTLYDPTVTTITTTP